MHGVGGTVAGEDTGAADAEDVDEVAVRDGEEVRVEPGPGHLRDPEALVALDFADARDDKAVRDCSDMRAARGHSLSHGAIL